MSFRGAFTYNNFVRSSWLFGIIVGFILLAFGLKLSSVHAQNININSARNCDNNAVIFCGAGAVDSLISKFNSGDGRNSAASIHNIFSFFGISSADINAMSSMSTDVEAGSVTRSGQVFDGEGHQVANNAITGGRDNIAGSTREVVGGTVFFTRPPSVSFVSSPLSAFVVMKDGRFAFAILASCGNAVKATPTTPAPTPRPTPTPPPTPTPVQTTPVSVSQCNGNTTNSNSDIASQGGNCSTNTTVVQNQVASSGVCTSLAITSDQNNPRAITATTNSSTQDGAQLQSVVFDFGDGTVTTPTTQTTMSHIFQQNGTFLIKATLNFTGSQVVAASTCEASITMNTTAPTCNELTVTQGDNRVVTISNLQTSPNGATFTGADINWGDGTTATNLPSLIGQTHQFTSDNTFTISAVARFSVNGQSVVADGQNCQTQVTFAPPTTPSSTPPVTTASTPTTPSSTLVNTGPGDVIALFGAITIIGTLGYRYMLIRYLNRSF